MARADSFQKKWASVPSQFERPADALIDRGWAGGAAEDPPEAKWENWWHNRVDEALAEIESKGAMQWFADVPYAIGAAVRSAGQNYIAALASTGIQPGSASDVGHWQQLSLLAATQAEAEAGTENTKRMTALRVRQAITKLFATQAQAEAGTDNATLMTPLRVAQAIANKMVLATESVVGMLRVGTQAEVNAGTLDDVVVTPKKLRWGFSISLGANGSIFFPVWLGSWVIMWGSATAGTGSGQIVTFPTAFPNACFFATPGLVNSPSSSVEYVQFTGATTTGITGVTYTNVSSSTAGTLTFGYFALGH